MFFSREYAEMMGYQDEAQLHFEKSRMAGTVENVVNTIEM